MQALLTEALQAFQLALCRPNEAPMTIAAAAVAATPEPAAAALGLAPAVASRPRVGGRGSALSVRQLSGIAVVTGEEVNQMMNVLPKMPVSNTVYMTANVLDFEPPRRLLVFTCDGMDPQDQEQDGWRKRTKNLVTTQGPLSSGATRRACSTS